MKLQPTELTPSAISALAPIMHCGFRMQNRQLFTVDSVDCKGYVILQIVDDMLFIVAFAGKGAIPLLRGMRDIAKLNGLKRVGWLSFHRLRPRALREFFVRVEKTDLPGEYRYSFLTGVNANGTD